MSIKFYMYTVFLFPITLIISAVIGGFTPFAHQHVHSPGAQKSPPAFILKPTGIIPWMTPATTVQRNAFTAHSGISIVVEINGFALADIGTLKLRVAVQDRFDLLNVHSKWEHILPYLRLHHQKPQKQSS